MHTTSRAHTAHIPAISALITASQALADLFESGDIVIEVLPHHDDESIVAVVDAFFAAVRAAQ